MRLAAERSSRGIAEFFGGSPVVRPQNGCVAGPMKRPTSMQRLPYRTNTTWLTDADLILLDVLFDGGATFCCLRHESFRRQWNVAYSHNLADTELRRRLEWLCEHCVLQTECHEGREFFHMSETGGELWSQERCPSWDRYCTERYKTTSRGRTLMSVAAVSPQIRDDFLRLWPPYPARSRTATIRDHGLIGWRRFAQLHVGLATYRDERQWTPEEYAVCVERGRDRLAAIECDRSWWRSVAELQKFVRDQLDAHRR